VVLQLPGETEPNLGQSGYTLAQESGSQITLVDPEWLTATMQLRGFTPGHRTMRPVPVGKQLWMAVFTRAQSPFIGDTP